MARRLYRLIPAAALVMLEAGMSLTTAADAQPGVTWELLGDVTDFNRFTSLAFHRGSSPDGTLDTLYVGSYPLHLYRYPPGGPLSEPLHQGGGGNEFVIATAAGTLLAGRAPGNLDRSTDGARTWIEVHYDTNALLQTTAPSLSGAVLAASVHEIWRSEADGAAGTWEQIGSAGGDVEALQDVTIGPHAGRLLAGVWNGATYSDDGGVTWLMSNLSLPGAMIVRSLAFHPEEGHPVGGVAYAGVRREGQAYVYRSDDAGATWALARWFEPGAFGVADPNYVTVAVGPDGVVWAGLWDVVGGAAPNPGTIVRSLDGGQTWEAAADGYGGWAVRALAFGRDRRLYLAADRGVWRTTTPVVATEQGAEHDAFGLEVRPNPSDGVVTVALRLPAPGPVRLVVYDSLGREVAVLHDGPTPAGLLETTWRAPRLSAGRYVVRAEALGGATTRPVVVTRE